MIFIRRRFGKNAFVYVLRLLYRTFKEKLKIKYHHPFMLGFGFTSTCIKIVQLILIKAIMRIKIIDIRHSDSLFLNVHYIKFTDRLSSTGYIKYFLLLYNSPKPLIVEVQCRQNFCRSSLQSAKNVTFCSVGSLSLSMFLSRLRASHE